jgi:hypothetical protein
MHKREKKKTIVSFREVESVAASSEVPAPKPDDVPEAPRAKRLRTPALPEKVEFIFKKLYYLLSQIFHYLLIIVIILIFLDLSSFLLLIF